MNFRNRSSKFPRDVLQANKFAANWLQHDVYPDVFAGASAGGSVTQSSGKLNRPLIAKLAAQTKWVVTQKACKVAGAVDSISWARANRTPLKCQNRDKKPNARSLADERIKTARPERVSLCLFARGARAARVPNIDQFASNLHRRAADSREKRKTEADALYERGISPLAAGENLFSSKRMHPIVMENAKGRALGLMHQSCKINARGCGVCVI